MKQEEYTRQTEHDTAKIVLPKDLAGLLHAIREPQPDKYDIMIRQGIFSYVEPPLSIDVVFCGFIGVDNPHINQDARCADLLFSLSYSVSNAPAQRTAHPGCAAPI